MPKPCIQPSFDSIESELEKVFSFISIGIETAILIVVLYFLIKLLRKTFSYKKNGLYEAIELHVVGLVALIIIIGSRLFGISSYNYQIKDNVNVLQLVSNKVFGNLLASMSVLFINDIYLFLSIIWLRFALQSDEKKKYKNMRITIKILGPYLVNLASAIVIAYLHIFAPSYDTGDYKEDTSYLVKSDYALIASTSITEIIFLYATFKIVKKCRQGGLKDYQHRSKKLIIASITLLIVSLARISFFIFQMVADPLKARNFNFDRCQDGSTMWAVGILLESIFLTIPPIVVFIVFLWDKFRKVRNPMRSHNLFQSAILQW